MLIDDSGTAVTAREANRLVLVHPEITDGGLRVTAPDAAPLSIARPDAGAQLPLTLWKSRLTAAAAGPQADAWFSDVLDMSVRLVWLDDPARRPTDAEFSDPDDRVSFADGYPLLVTTESSLAALNDHILASAQHDRDPIPMTRFRPNVVVSGTQAWVEDDWRLVRIGAVRFRAVKGCARCVLTTIDPETAEREREPIASLARQRRWDGKTWFGVNLIPEAGAAALGEIRVGDDVEVVQQVSPGAGPLRRSDPSGRFAARSPRPLESR